MVSKLFLVTVNSTLYESHLPVGSAKNNQTLNQLCILPRCVHGHYRPYCFQEFRSYSRFTSGLVNWRIIPSSLNGKNYRDLGLVFPSPIKSNFISDLLILD